MIGCCVMLVFMFVFVMVGGMMWIRCGLNGVGMM